MMFLRFRTRTWMAIVLYAAVDLAARHAAFTWGSLLGLGVFILLTWVVPLAGILRWMIGGIRRDALFRRDTLY
jgi:hypothetical protein